ncbi:MAG: hypothetical protein AMJ43_03960 [Coxiella sp. DG_40]|nr:MAG: hypothetical protein AMJ43_03960 [Coxiella sp. DG_40]
MKRIFLTFLYYLSLSIAILLILIILGFYALEFVTTPYLQRYHYKLEKLNSYLIHYPVKFDTVVIRRSGINPEFEFHNAIIYDKANSHKIAKFNELIVSIDLIKSIFKRHIEYDLLVSGAQFNLYQDKDFSFSNTNKISKSIEDILSWMFLFQNINLQNINVTWHTADGKKIICSNLKLQIKNKSSQHQIIGTGSLTQQFVTKFKFVINFEGDDIQSKETIANGYIKLIEKDKININLWFNYEQQAIRQLQTQFVISNVTLHPPSSKRKIYIYHLAGNALLNHKKDIWSLIGNYRDFKVNFDDMFRDSIKLDKLQGTIDWQHSNHIWQIWASNIVAQNNELNFNADAHLLLPTDTNKLIANVTANYDLKKVVHASNYCPVKVMPKSIINWLNHSIIDGKNITGKIILRGPLAKFPFNHHNGNFLFNSTLHDIKLKFNPNWPAISHINADMQFDGHSIQINGDGKIIDVPLHNVHVLIPEVQQPKLNASGNINSDNIDLMKLIYHSPLKNSIAKYSLSAQAFGPVSLRFTIPSLNNMKKTYITGVLVERKGSLKIPDWKINLKNIKGNIYFSENSVHGNNIIASLFNGPIKINVTTNRIESQTNGSVKTNGVNLVTLIKADGEALIGSIQNQFHSPILQRMAGKFDYTAALHLYNNKKYINRFTLLSNLQRVKINLPDPFAKSENQIRDLYIKAKFDTEKFIQLTLKCGNDISTMLNFAKTAQKLKFVSGSLHFGAGLATFQKLPGLLISGHLPEIVWSNWQPYISKQMTGKQSIVRKIDVDTNKLQFYNQVLPNTKLSITPEAKFWQVQLNNEKADGQLNIPYNFPQQVLEARFNKLYLTYDKNKAYSLQPTNIPPIHIISNDFRYGEKEFGYVELNVTPHYNVLQINKLAVNSPTYNLLSTGKWEVSNGKQYSMLNGTLETDNAGILLKEWNKTNALIGGSGKVTFTLRWSGNIYEPSLKTMNGNIMLDFKQGRIVNLNEATEKKIDIGRILNILSLQSLSRRLTLNFDDLTKKGFSFDEMKGDFKLIGGDMYTYNSYLNGIVADILAQGRIGLINRDCDLVLTMIPHVTSSLPVLATLIGGPVAGVITLVGDELFKHTLQSSIAYMYKVTGFWENPYVIKLNSRDKLPLDKE